MTTIEQGGAIAFRVVEKTAQFLLVTAKRNPNQWIFPKGHVEPGESVEEAAARELLEEGGVEGKPLGYVGNVEFEQTRAQVRVEHYLFESLREFAMSESRERRWCTFEEALIVVSFPSARVLLATARMMIPVEGNAP